MKTLKKQTHMEKKVAGKKTATKRAAGKRTAGPKIVERKAKRKANIRCGRKVKVKLTKNLRISEVEICSI